MRWPLVVIASIGCGRIGFDPLSGSPDGTVVVGTSDGALGTWLVPSNPGTSAPCTFDTVYHDGCDHPAEHLVVRVADTQADCGKLELGDDLHAFDWSCRREGGDIVFQSLGLAAAAGLSTLVDENGWKPNRFFAFTYLDGVERFASEPAVWWDNPVVPLPDNSTGGEVTLDQTHTIYVLGSSRATSGYKIGADYIGIVVLPGAVLSAGTIATNCGDRGMLDAKCLVEAMQPHVGTWIEGELGGDGILSNEAGVVLTDAQWPTLRHVTAHGFTYGLYFYKGAGALAFDISATRNGYAIDAENANVTARHVFAADNITGFGADAGGYHVLTDVRAYNNNDSIKLINNAAGLISNVFTAHNNGSSIWFSEALNGGSLHAITAFTNQGPVYVQMLAGGSVNRVVSASNNGDGLLLSSVSSSVISQVVGTDTTGYGIEMTGCTNDTVIGNLIVGNDTNGSCSVTGGSNVGLDSACNHVSGQTVTSQTLTASFAGGTGTANEATLANWSLPLREQVWGADGTGPLDPASRGRCLQGQTCHQWDYSLSPSDNVLHDAAESGVPSSASPFVPASPCPPAAYATVSAPNEQCFPGYPAPCPRIYLANALEILDDHYGNDDGFCESAERCTYLPHMTSYPERGTPSDGCLFQDGVVSNVTLYDLR